MVRLHAACLLLLAIPSGMAFAEAADLKFWWSDYGSAYRLAQKEGKPLLVVFENSGLRGQPSQHIHIKSQNSDAKLLTAYVLCRIDASSEEGRELARQFAAPGFPSVVITDKRLDRVIYRRHGPLSTLDWSTMLVSYRSGERLPKKEARVPTEPQKPAPAAKVCYT